MLFRSESAGFETLGPAPVPPGPGSERPPASASGSDASDATVRALIRTQVDRGHELAAMLRVRQRERSARREEAVRVELDPTVLW